MKMSLAYIVINARNVALEDREIVFNSIGVGIAAHIFLCTMLDRFVAGKCLPDA